MTEAVEVANGSSSLPCFCLLLVSSSSSSSSSSRSVALELTGERKYTTKRYLELAKDLNDKAKQLNNGGDDDGNCDSFTCEEIERAIWTAAVLSSSSSGAKKLMKKK